MNQHKERECNNFKTIFIWSSISEGSLAQDKDDAWIDWDSYIITNAFLKFFFQSLQSIIVPNWKYGDCIMEFKDTWIQHLYWKILNFKIYYQYIF